MRIAGREVFGKMPRDLMRVFSITSDLPNCPIVFLLSGLRVADQTVLLDIPITFNVTGSREVRAWINIGCGNQTSSSTSARLKTCVQFGYVWVSLGQPKQDIFEMPEYYEPDRRNIHAATIRVKVSAPRAIENFLDLAHFPFVHPL